MLEDGPEEDGKEQIVKIGNKTSGNYWFSVCYKMAKSAEQVPRNFFEELCNILCWSQPGQVVQLVGVLFHTPKGCGFDPQ